MKKKFYILISIFVLVLAAGLLVNIYFPKNKTQNLNTTINQQEKKPLVVPEEPVKTDDESVSGTIPKVYKIDNVPFVPQAPYANWDELHDAACEEASLIIAYYYLNNKSLSADVMENEIQKMVTWEIKNWGGHYDLTASETADLGKSFYNLDNIRVKNINSLSDIKKEISQNHLVIVPAAGRLLGNPNYRSPGPVYHMLVVTGYNEDQIITNDIGTRRGENYAYANSILFNAIHDWVGSPDNIESGDKVMMVFQD